MSRDRYDGRLKMIILNTARILPWFRVVVNLFTERR